MCTLYQQIICWYSVHIVNMFVYPSFSWEVSRCMRNQTGSFSLLSQTNMYVACNCHLLFKVSVTDIPWYSYITPSMYKEVI